jgi:hypothetical protein
MSLDSKRVSHTDEALRIPNIQLKAGMLNPEGIPDWETDAGVFAMLQFAWLEIMSLLIPNQKPFFPESRFQGPAIVRRPLAEAAEA